MKVRSDFVTNSSSSSYVIAYKNDKEINDGFTRLRNEIIETIKDAQPAWGWSEEYEGKTFTSLRDFENYLFEEKGWEYNSPKEMLEALKNNKDIYYSGIYETYQKVAAYLNQLYTIMVKRIPYDAHEANLIYALDECSESFNLIRSENE